MVRAAQNLFFLGYAWLAADRHLSNTTVAVLPVRMGLAIALRRLHSAALDGGARFWVRAVPIMSPR